MRSKLRDHENSLFVTRTHWLTVWKAFIILVAATAFVYVSFLVVKPGPSVSTLRTASLIVFLVALLFFGYREWYRRRDIWVVTNIRVIDEEGIFTLITKESPLEKINNISYRQTILGRILNYGEVEIQTAAEHGATIYTMITNPKMLKEVVANARDQYAKNLAKSPAGDLISHA